MRIGAETKLLVYILFYHFLTTHEMIWIGIWWMHMGRPRLGKGSKPRYMEHDFAPRLLFIFASFRLVVIRSVETSQPVHMEIDNTYIFPTIMNLRHGELQSALDVRWHHAYCSYSTIDVST